MKNYSDRNSIDRQKYYDILFVMLETNPNLRISDLMRYDIIKYGILKNVHIGNGNIGDEGDEGDDKSIETINNIDYNEDDYGGNVYDDINISSFF